MTYYFMMMNVPVMLILALYVVFARNIVRAAFALALFASSISISIICFGNSLMGVLILVVYVGAIVVFFLVAVMMISQHEVIEDASRVDYFTSIFVCLMCVVTFFVLQQNPWSFSNSIKDQLLYVIEILPGSALYTVYNRELQLVALILLAAVIGVVNITFTYSINVHNPNSRSKVTVNELMDIDPKEQIKLIKNKK